MIQHEVKVHPAASPLPREDQLAWKLASLATLPAIDADTAELVAALSRAVAIAYEVHVALVKAISLHRFKKDHVAHLAPRDRGRHRASARPAGSRRLPGGQPSRPSRLLDAPVAQGRDQLVEGLRAGLLRQAGDRGDRPRDARRGRAEPDLRGRGFGDRLDAWRQGRGLHGRAAGARRAAAPSTRPIPRRIRPSTIGLWRKIRTVEDSAWTARYHQADPARRAFGGRLRVTLRDGRIIEAEKAVADAHPNGRKPWRTADYLGKFHALADDLVAPAEGERFLATAQRLVDLSPAEIRALNPVMPDGTVHPARPTGEGILDWKRG